MRVCFGMRPMPCGAFEYSSSKGMAYRAKYTNVRPHWMVRRALQLHRERADVLSPLLQHDRRIARRCGASTHQDGSPPLPHLHQLGPPLQHELSGNRIEAAVWWGRMGIATLCGRSRLQLRRRCYQERVRILQGRCGTRKYSPQARYSRTTRRRTSRTSSRWSLRPVQPSHPSST
jgi:hypothetical protein